MRVKTLCLGALCLGDATGYDIKKLFEAAFNHFHGASFGSIYPSLKQLEQEELVDLHVEAGEKHPDRKLYKVTDSGRSAFIEELAQTPASEQLSSDFLVLLFFAHLLPTDVLRQKLAEIETYYCHELEYLESLSGCPRHTTGIDFTIGMGKAALRTKLAYLREQRDQLLATHLQLPDAARDEMLHADCQQESTA
ncbi:MAG: PadR family transcriptional regulator [Pseudomonadota bacterium]